MTDAQVPVGPLPGGGPAGYRLSMPVCGQSAVWWASPAKLSMPGISGRYGRAAKPVHITTKELWTLRPSLRWVVQPLPSASTRHERTLVSNQMSLRRSSLSSR